jgi:hypothetical protein
MNNQHPQRRKEDKMASNFEPQTAFEGYVKASLDNLEKRFDNLPCGEGFKRINKLETEQADMKGRATVLGATAGIVGAILFASFKWLMSKI